MLKNITFFFLCTYACGYGQKAYNNNFYAFMPYSYNAAYAGWSEGLSVFLQFAGQNKGLPTSPKTTSFFLTKGIFDYGGLGIRAFVDERGVFKTTRFQIEASYKATFDPITPHVLRLGVSGGAHWERLNFDAIERNGYTDLNDPLLYNREGMNLRFGAALAYELYGLELGLSLPFILSLYEENGSFLEDLSYAVHYSFSLNDDTWTIQPMYLGHFLAAGLHLYDAIVLMNWDDRFWWHAGYRSNQSFLAAVGFGLKGFTVGYATELPFGNYAVIAGLAHTVMIALVADERFFRKKKKKKGKGFYPGRRKPKPSEEEATD